ncbi:unnamed protein product, partial [Mesorhabditis belari]|uniref:RRM domain-containing protein n=1 Tax=Mesorhabditis belari TaxID=2138241 RepID=A0AAF3F0A9_9BILA
MAMAYRKSDKLPPEINNILFVKNLPFKITAKEMYDIFGKFGAVRQIRVGKTPQTRGTAFIVYEDIMEAKNACEKLQGYNVSNRYLVVLYYQITKVYQRLNTEEGKRKLEQMKSKYGLGENDKKGWEAPGFNTPGRKWN